MIMDQIRHIVGTMHGHRCSGMMRQKLALRQVNHGLVVNPNHKEINVEAALADPDSIFYTYQTLVAFEKRASLVCDGWIMNWWTQ